MRLSLTMICVCATFTFKLFSQMQPQDIKVTRSKIGISAISVNTLVAKTFNLIFPVYDYKFDTLSNQLFFSTRQKGEGSTSAYLSRGFFAALNAVNDSIKWINESSLYDLKVSKNHLLLSNEVKTARYNKLHGYDEIKYDSKIFYTFPKYSKGLTYSRTENNVLQCVGLAMGNVTWTCSIPSNEDWVDSQYLNDSVLLVAAGGLHAINVKSGLVWSHPSSTSVKTNRSFVYSLAKFLTIQKVSSVIKTSSDETLVTQIASNIIKDKERIYFASKEKFIAVTHAGKLVWEVDLKNYPTSKMYISKTDTSIILVNFGLATHSNNFVTWGKPFILTINPANGKIETQFDLSNIENLADFVQTDKSLIFAGKDGILEVKPGQTELKTVFGLSEQKFGQFVEFINGNEFYILKEGYFIPLNFINDNPIYFRADNNKIYGLEGENLSYEYHYTELYKLDKKFQNKTILISQNKTLITNSNFELLFTFDLIDKNIVTKDHIYFIGDQKIHSLRLSDLK